jgi:hypothetical protein
MRCLASKLIPVHLVAVELGAVDADKTRLPAHLDAAGAAHAGAVDHDRVQADDGRHAKGLGGEASKTSS